MRAQIRLLAESAAALVLGFTVGYAAFTVCSAVFGVPEPVNDLMATAISFFHTHLFHV
jgi:hypothetical protein